MGADSHAGILDLKKGYRAVGIEYLLHYVEVAKERARARGFDVNSDALVDALKAAWLQLNIGQIAAGVKEPEV